MTNQEETCRHHSGLRFTRCCGRASFPESVDNNDVERIFRNIWGQDENSMDAFVWAHVFLH